MPTFCVSHLSNAVLLCDCRAMVCTDRANTARMLAHIAEIDARRMLCHAHNQLAAERVYGERFMRGKREGARREACATMDRRGPSPAGVPPAGP